jgi:hypothetical protein
VVLPPARLVLLGPCCYEGEGKATLGKAYKLIATWGIYGLVPGKVGARLMGLAKGSMHKALTKVLEGR